jgi:cephalosporin hydroxylase
MKLAEKIKCLFYRFSITQKRERLPLQWTKEMWNSGLWMSITWLGVPILQWPTDLIILQEIVCEQKPRFIIETGTAKGGSAIFFASLLKLLNIKGKIISIDKYLTEETKRLTESHPMGRDVILHKGDSISHQTIRQIKQIVKDEKNIMVFLDSDHSYQHVLSELNHYQHFVPLDGYLCAFDTIMKDLYDMPKGEKRWRTDNPHKAVMDFLKENDCFEIDKSRNRLLVGFGPDSFLKRVKE